MRVAHNFDRMSPLNMNRGVKEWRMHVKVSAGERNRNGNVFKISELSWCMVGERWCRGQS